jgi:hypothetical protein
MGHLIDTLMYNHPIERTKITWETYGIDGKGPPRRILVKDLTNSHLINIIKHINDNPKYYNQDCVVFIRTELLYRRTHNINVILKFGR